MQAVQINEFGGPEVLTFTEIPDPVVKTGEVLIDVFAAGVNYYDTYQREGEYAIPLPYVPGLEGAGRVRAVGEGVEGISTGDRVAWPNTLGSYAPLVAVPAARLVHIPETLSTETAAACLLQGMTACLLVDRMFPITAGDPVLVHAAAGGLGNLLTQLVTARGGRVIATVSTQEKAQLAREAGAVEVLGYDDHLAEAVRDLTGGAGVAVAFDGVGAATIDASLGSLRRRGALVLFGAASGAVESIQMRVLHAGSLFLCRPSIFHFIEDRDELLALSRAAFAAVENGALSIRIGHTYPLDKASTAHEDLQARRTNGKILLFP